MQRVLDLATPGDIMSAMGAYPKYHRITANVAALYGYSPRVGAAIFAALSPNNDYLGNLRDKRKAWDIVCGADPLDLIIALKTRSFFLNVANPDDPWPVTVDGHLTNIWNGKRQGLVGLRERNPRLYETIASAVRDLARSYGWLPNQTQGVLWATWRRIHGIKTSGQREFWDTEYLAAGLGFHLCS